MTDNNAPPSLAYPVSTYVLLLYFSVVFQSALYLTGIASAVGIRNSLLYTLPWLAIVALLPVRAARPVITASALVLFTLSLAKIGYLVLYKQEMSQGVLYSIFESNVSESEEFVQHYLNWWAPILALSYGLPAVWIWKAIKPCPLPARTRLTVLVLACLPLLEPFSKAAFSNAPDVLSEGRSRLENRLMTVTPWQTLLSYHAYRNNLDEVNTRLAMLSGGSHGPHVARHASAPERATIIVVIGESTSRGHLSLYGYPRRTTPVLDAMKDHLLVFNDVVSPRTYTIEALAEALSFSDQAHPERLYQDHNLVSLMKDAGFETWWISNQQTLSSRNTLLTALASQADHPAFLNNNRSQSSSQYDDVVMPAYLNALHQPAPRKLIVVHLMGTHFGYHHRYPDTAAVFDGMATPTAYSRNNEDTYNAYDNAVLFQDEVLGKIFDAALAQEDYTAVVYFSDHGEEVFDSKPMNGRNEYSPTEAMYTIPFVIAGNTEFQKTLPGRSTSGESLINRPYSTEHLIHTLCGLASLDYPSCEPQHDILDPHFIVSERLVGNPDDPKSLRNFLSLVQH